MSNEFDYKKAYSDLYLPPTNPELADVPLMRFIMVDGKRHPENNEAYQHAISLLYALSFTIKMSKMESKQPAGYFEYVVPPLEGLWWGDQGIFDLNKPDTWCWTAMIRQPEFVTPKVYQWATDEVRKKKPELNVDLARFETLYEGWCVQMMHVGPYSNGRIAIEKMKQFMAQNGYQDITGIKGKYHEIYLSDPRKTAPDKLKTVLRLPVQVNS